MLLSIVIPTHNRGDILRRTLTCLEAQNLPGGMFEVIVVDDASEDDTYAFLSSYAPPFAFRSFRQERCGGPAKARNVGIVAAKGDITVILNDDALLAPDALSIHAAVHTGLSGQSVSVLGRFDLPEDFTAGLWGYTLQNSDLLFRYPALRHNGLYGHESWWSCNISTPRRALLEAGLFDENFTDGAWGAEDQELGRRLLQNNVPVLYRADCRATHLHLLDVDGFERMSRARGGGGVILFSKHGIPCHYSGRITEADVAFWRNLPPRLVTATEELHELVRQTEKLFLPRSVQTFPYYERNAYPEARETAYGLFALRTRDLLRIVADCRAQMERLLARAHDEELDMEDAAALLYPVCLMLRFFHDSVGICAVPVIHRLTAETFRDRMIA